MSNESFSWFLKQHADGPDAQMDGWDNGFRTSNMQVGMLASVPKGVAVTRNDLKKAKRIVSNNNGKIKWVIGTTDTMHEFYLELAARAGRNVTNAEAAAARARFPCPHATDTARSEPPCTTSLLHRTRARTPGPWDP